MNLNVSLTDDLVNFVKSKVNSGLYTSSSEVVREALRLLAKQDRLENETVLRLRQDWESGIASGDFQPLDMPSIKAGIQQRLQSKA